MEIGNGGSGPGRLVLVGTGPGSDELLTPAARQALEEAECLVGYRTYMDQISHLLRPDQQVFGSSMMQEIDRCRKAIELASSGRDTALVCGGDPGIYSMAGLVLELMAVAEDAPPLTRVEVIPGIPALNACAALLGAPLMHDFAAVSLSDLLTPWPLIEKRLRAAAEADFVIVLYNPASKRRRDHAARAAAIVMESRDGATPVGIVRSAYRPDQSMRITTLDRLAHEELDMRCTVIIGNSRTFVHGGRMVTPRGYGDKYGL